MPSIKAAQHQRKVSGRTAGGFGSLAAQGSPGFGAAAQQAGGFGGFGRAQTQGSAFGGLGGAASPSPASPAPQSGGMWAMRK